MLTAMVLILAACSRTDEEPAEEQSPFQRELATIVEEFDNRTVYTSLDPETLATIPDDWLVQAVVDFVASKLGDDITANRDRVDALPAAVRGVFATYWLEADVYNGGYNQYFWNPYGYWVRDAIAAYEDYGAVEHAVVTRKAVAIFLEESETHREFREIGTLEAFSESYEATGLGDVNAEFWALTDPSSKRVAYIRANPDKFTTD